MNIFSSARHYHKDLIGRALFYSGAYRRFSSDRGVVLAYHSISDAVSPVTCSPKAFERQCRLLAKYFDVVSVDEFLRILKTGRSLEGKTAITFDDGYADNFEIAAKVLSQYNLPATFFVATRFIGSDHVAWWDEQSGIQSRWMTWDDVRALSDSGFTIGGHTQRHVDLASVDPILAEKEIRDCRDDLRRELGIDSTLFAYPYGRPENINAALVEIVRQNGFECCFSCHGGIVNPTDSAFELLRLPVSSWHISAYHLGAQILRDFRAA